MGNTRVSMVQGFRAGVRRPALGGINAGLLCVFLTTSFCACKSAKRATPMRTSQALHAATVGGGHTAALVVAAVPLSPADAVLQTRLAALGYDVTAIDDDATTSSDADGKDFHNVSHVASAAY